MREREKPRPVFHRYLCMSVCLCVLFIIFVSFVDITGRVDEDSKKEWSERNTNRMRAEGGRPWN